MNKAAYFEGFKQRCIERGVQPGSLLPYVKAAQIMPAVPDIKPQTSYVRPKLPQEPHTPKKPRPPYKLPAAYKPETPEKKR